MDPYKVLGVGKSASKKDIERAARKLAIKLHPDKNRHLDDNKKKENEERYKEVQIAKEILIDDEKRERYDKYGVVSDEEFAEKMGGMQGMGVPGFSFPGGVEINVNDIFGGGFPGMSGMRRERREVAPVRVPVIVSLEELYKGGKKMVTYERISFKKDKSGKAIACSVCSGRGYKVQTIRRGPMTMQNQSPCTVCNTTGKKVESERLTIPVTISRGLVHGSEIKLKNAGNELPSDYQTPQKTKSDVILIIREKEHPVFKHNFSMGNRNVKEDLLLLREITMAESLCGYFERVKHLDGKEFIIEVDEVIKDDDIFFVHNKGMPHSSGHGFGNLLVKFSIKDQKVALSSSTKKVIWEELTGMNWTTREKEMQIKDSDDAPKARHARDLDSDDFSGGDFDERGGAPECAAQ